MTSTTLEVLPAGVAGVVTSVDVPSALGRRLAELGIRTTAVVVAKHRTAGGARVVEVAGTRIALARDVLRAIAVEASP